MLLDYQLLLHNVEGTLTIDRRIGKNFEESGYRLIGTQLRYIPELNEENHKNYYHVIGCLSRYSKQEPRD
jgi:hypothetical protein